MTLLTKREQQELILFNKQRKRIGEPKLTEEEYYRYLYGKGLPAKKVKIAEKPYKGISVPTWAITTSHIPSHVMLGEHLIKGIIAENKDVLSDIDMSISSDFGNDLKNIIDNALYLEDRFIDYAIPSGMLGYNTLDHQKTARHYAERWLKRIGLNFNLEGEHKLPWIDEQLSLRKEKNFFETRVTEYRVGANLWAEDEKASNPTHPEWDDPLNFNRS